MRVLGIEGTAHTISAGVIDEKEIYFTSSRTYQPKDGGIHPREAANHHFENITEVVRESLLKSGLSIRDIDLIGFSKGPGLGPCLKIAAVGARSLAIKNNIPLLGVNHPMGHIEIGKRTTGSSDPIVLYVSGGNTQIIAGFNGIYHVIGETLDIGIGNMLDKFAREIGVPFPGGPAIEDYARNGKELLKLPYSVKGMDTSFSGILTAALSLKKKGNRIEDICFSIQETAFSMLCETLERGIYTTGKKEILLTGGVARNMRLREMISIMSHEADCKVFETPLEYCMDNGSMIAQAALLMFQNGIRQNLEETVVDQRFRIDEATAPWITSEMKSAQWGKGAESIIKEDRFLNMPSIIKKRVPKNYRNKILDESILRERTGRELRILSRGIESGLSFPMVFDFIHPNEIKMEKIDGNLLGDIMMRGGKQEYYMQELGVTIARMHTAGISHGDVNINNIIISGDDIYLIDPSMGSLSPGIEEFATDLKMIQDFLHGNGSAGEKLFSTFIGSYSANFREWEKVKAVLEDMERRKRYS